MKKIFSFVLTGLLLLVLVGCTMDNTPTKKVERFLNNYRTLSSDVTNQMDEIVNTDSLMSEEQRASYKDILRKQYQDLKYEIKDETIDGDAATVRVEIEVYDFYKTTKDAEEYYTTHQEEFYDQNGTLDESKYIDYRIEQMKKQQETVKYTIDFTLTKKDKVWQLDDIDDATRQKIHGLYAY